MPKTLHLSVSDSNCGKPKLNKKILKRVRGIIHLTYKGSKRRMTSNFSLETQQGRQVEGNIKCDKRKKALSWSFVAWEITLQKWRTNEDFPRQKKIEEMCSW